jgi:fumarate reductase subunit C
MISSKSETHLWIAQRLSAVVLALCVLVHLATIIYAVQGGLTATEILGRTRGNAAWAAFYTLFVLAAAVHAPIGLRTVCGEWLRWRGPSREVVMLAFCVAIFAAGMRAVLSVFT